MIQGLKRNSWLRLKHVYFFLCLFTYWISQSRLQLLLLLLKYLNYYFLKFQIYI